MRVFRGHGRQSAVFRGFPDDLAWYTPETKPGFTVIAQTTSGIFKATAEDEQEAITKALSAVSGGELGEKIISVPLVDGSCVTDGDEPPRTDSFYCWLLSRESRNGSRKLWSVTYRTNPDEETFHLTPGIGIVGYEYHHHGTLASAEVHLIRHTAK